MTIVKILGLIDLIASITLFSLIFGVNLPLQIIVFLGGILFMKSLFLLTGDILSAFDLISAIVFFVSFFTQPWTFLIWICSLVLMTKGLASFF